MTGCGSRGDGWGNDKAIAVLPARRGAQVYKLDRDLAAVEGGSLASDECDVTKTAEV